MLNKILLIGNLGRDPERNSASDGTPITKFSLAVNSTYKTKSGEKKEETEWFTIVAWRQLAETCERYLHKGSRVYIEGRLSQRKYTDREGIQRIAVDVIANDMKMLDPKPVASEPESYVGVGAEEGSDPFLPDYHQDIPE